MTLAEELRSKLNEGMVSFSYRKVNGEWREAHGTRNPEGIEALHGDIPKGTGKEIEGTIAYWDIDAEGWRSCREDSVIAVNSNCTVEEWKQNHPEEA